MEKLILECALRSLLIAVCTAVVLYALRVKAARVRHGVWAGVVALMLVLPVWTAWGPKAVLRVLTPLPVMDVQSISIVQTLPDQAPPAPPVKPVFWTWQNSLLAVYLLGFAALISRLAIGTARARAMVHKSANRGGRLTSDACVTPITVGWFTPSVILPPAWLRWSRAQLNAVLAHEDEHARRRDPLVQWLALLNRAVFWFHPLAWWLERQLSALAEEACDDAVLERGHDPLQYSEYLLGLARLVQQSGARVNVVGMAMPGTFLPQRIRRIATGTPVQRISRGRVVGLAMTCAMMSMVFTAGAVGYSVPAASSGEPNVVREVTQDVSAPAGIVQPLVPRRAAENMSRPKGPVLLAQAATTNLPNPVAASSAITGQSMSGVVMDPSGAVVASAPVTLMNTDTGATVSASTDNVGRYRFENINAGTYNVTLRVPGFKAPIQTGIRVADGDAHNAGSMMLQLGAISGSVSVTGSRSAIVPFIGTLAPMTILSSATGPTALADRAAQSTFRFIIGRQPNPTNSGGPVRVGGNVQPARLVNVSKPIYPPELEQQGIEGTVKMEAVLSKDGTLSDIRVISVNMDPRLTQLALDAVKQWRYQPTLLNGEPVETQTTIDVNFSLTN